MSKKRIADINRLLFLFSAGIVFAFNFFGCNVKPAARGELDEIYVFADKNIYSACGEYIQKSLGRTINTPQHEPLFNIIHKDFSEFSDYYKNPNILMLCALEDSGQVTEYVRKMLDASTFEGVKNSVYWIFSKENPWYSGQRLVIACANDAGELSSRLDFGSDELFMTFNEAYLNRLKKELYSRLENKELSKKLFENYGFRIRIQHDYYLTTENVEERMIRLRRTFPDRWLSISWSESAVDSLTKDIVVEERKRMSKLFADPSLIYTEYNVFEGDFGDIPGSLFMRGLWGTEANIGGGPFFTYAVRDDSSGIVYFIDGAVFAPEYRKMPFIKQLEVMAGTFIPPSLVEE